MIAVKEELDMAFANLNAISATLSLIKDLSDLAEYQMIVDEYFHTVLTLERVNQALGILEKVVQKHQAIKNR